MATIHDEIVVECREQDAEEVLTMTKTAMLDGMKQLAKDCPVEVEAALVRLGDRLSKRLRAAITERGATG